MTEIADPPRAQPPQQAPETPPPATGADPMISSDFETFLRMLTAQLENQDPLNPLEASDFAVQLATFSGVEQQVRTNELLGDLQARIGAMGMAELAGWVGMQARAPVPAQFSGAPVALFAETPAGTAAAEVTVAAEDGRVVERFAIPAEGGELAWSGLRPDGSAYPNGRYSFEVISYDAAGAELGRAAPQLFATVLEARNAEAGTQLVLEGGHVVEAAEIGALRPRAE